MNLWNKKCPPGAQRNYGSRCARKDYELIGFRHFSVETDGSFPLSLESRKRSVTHITSAPMVIDLGPFHATFD